MTQICENRNNTRSAQKSQMVYIIRFSSVSSTFKEQINIIIYIYIYIYIYICVYIYVCLWSSMCCVYVCYIYKIILLLQSNFNDNVPSIIEPIY